MKQYLSIAVLCAIVAGVIGLRGAKDDGWGLANSESSWTSIDLQQNLPVKNVLPKDNTIAEWTHPPIPVNKSTVDSRQSADQQFATTPDATSTVASTAAHALWIAPKTQTDQFFVQQASFLSPAPETNAVVADSSGLYQDPVPDESDSDDVMEDQPDETSEEDFDAFSDDESLEDPDDEDFEPAPSDFNTSRDAPPAIANESEQIGVILDQIGNHRVTNAANEIRWSLDDAILASLAYSNRVSSLRIESTEALQNVGVEYGQFDIAAFVTQSFRDSAEPVGSSIDTASGVQPIVNEDDLNVAYGLRRQLRSGGDFEISQSYQFLDNDSGILVPEDQAIARLNARLSKELLRGAGRSIAMNQVLVAYHDASAQRSESVANIADHLNEVMTAYWDIFAARGALFASMENRELAIEVRRELNARRDIDAEPNLIDQSEATVRQRDLQIIEAHSNLIKAQIQFVSLVNAPELLDNLNDIEILPQVSPDLDHRELDIASRINTAIQRRPEIGDIIEQIKSAQATNHLSLNDLLPRLALSLETSLNGLEGDSQLGDAIGNQFENDLTYQVGVDFEVPLANRRARFNRRRTELTVARLRADWQNLIQQVRADVLDNAQEFSASQLRLETQREVLKFSSNELRYLALRKTVAPKESDNVSFALTQVLSAQDRQVEAKSDFIAAIADKYRAIFELNRATGILINSDVIPQDGGPARPGFFSVYHHYIEERGSFEGPLGFVEDYTRAKSKDYKFQSGVHSLNLDSCPCPPAQTQTIHSASEPAFESVEEVILPIPQQPIITAPPRYPLQ